MKQLTTIKSIFASPLFRKSIILGIVLWIFFAIPGYVLTWNYLAKEEMHKNEEQRIANESILTNIFETHARFGDLVNARGFIIEKAKPLGLVTLLICDDNKLILSTLKLEECPIHKNYIFVDVSGKKLRLLYIWQDLKLSSNKILETALFVSLLLVSFLVFSVSISTYLLTRKSLKEFSIQLSELAATDGIPYFPSFPEVTPVINALRSLKTKLNEFKEKEIEMIITKKTSDIAKQVSHDIRSPLAALNMVVSDLGNIADDKRILIRNSVSRINDIANTLLSQSKKREIQHGIIEMDEIVELVPALLDSIVSEKRVQFRDRARIKIETDFFNSYGAFATINPADLKRVISNLINNSVEASKLDSVKVKVSVRSTENKIKIMIKDDGKGIPPTIIDRLGQTTFSYGKEKSSDSGSGIGLLHAKNVITNAHGEMIIESEEGVGTTISIIFPRSKTPEWFVEKIIVDEKQFIVVVDDDITIHQAWQGRFGQVNNKIEIAMFSSALEFENWFSLQNRELIERMIFLFDYELSNQSMTGLDIVEKYQLQKKSILVTSRYEEVNLRKHSEDLKLKIIPKGMLGIVPIEINEISIDSFYSRCLIDDDALVRMTWEWAAKKDNIKFLACDSLSAFQEQIMKVNIDTEIYIDVNLANNIMGQDVADILFKQGFKKIYFATGYDPTTLTDIPNYILGVIGKNPPRS
ncbi:MAG: HAMP domain-containing histidine kinase [Bacteriovorax sp.]|nr:HAMP domain-containing histidine kinase [Bacteriovorax sp.]